MSKTKEFYHDEICKMDSLLSKHYNPLQDESMDFSYENYLREEAKRLQIALASEHEVSDTEKEKINTVLFEENEIIEEQAEKAAFFNIFDKTNSYPI